MKDMTPKEFMGEISNSKDGGASMILRRTWLFKIFLSSVYQIWLASSSFKVLVTNEIKVYLR